MRKPICNGDLHAFKGALIDCLASFIVVIF